MGERNKQIDGLRGFACLMIIFFHIFCRYQQIFHDSNVPFMQYWGEFGVSIFLIISVSLLITTRKHFFYLYDVLKWWIKKFLRLWPSYIVAISIISIVNSYINLPGRATGIKDYILNLFWINGFIGTSYVDSAHWYITVLLSLTFVFGILYYLKIISKVWAYIFWLILAFILHYTPVNFLLRFIGNNFIGIACTSVAIKMMLGRENSSLKKLEWAIVAIGGCLYTLVYRGFGYFICYILAAILVIFAFNNRLSFLENRLFTAVGIISYPLYLIHQNISYFIQYKFEGIFGNYSILYGLLSLITIVLLAIFLFYCVEKPTQQIIKKLFK